MRSPFRSRIRVALGVAGLAVVSAIGACASAGGGGGGGGNDAILQAEIQASALGDADAYRVVQALRPAWLRRRSSGISLGGAAGGGGGFDAGREEGFAAVFLGSQEYGDLDTLRQFDSTAIERIEFISALDATTRFGTGYTSGIIQLTIR